MREESLRWVHGENIRAQILNEFSLTDLLVRIEIQTKPGEWHEPDIKWFTERWNKKLLFGECCLVYMILWVRQESDARGPYLAAALTAWDPSRGIE